MAHPQVPTWQDRYVRMQWVWHSSNVHRFMITSLWRSVNVRTNRIGMSTQTMKLFIPLSTML